MENQFGKSKISKVKKQKSKPGLSILLVAMSLATAWAVRGQFGHEQGAAWAGGIGALALVLISRRNDWYQRIFTITLASAIGWGMGGMISYGAVVGYGRSDNFPNAFYGLLMLFVIGGLFGLMGGGLAGLALESTKEKRVNWAGLFAEMVAGGIIFYGFLVKQLGILMTPPRAENWAIVLGAGVAMIWYMARNGFYSSLRVALYTFLGAGFGFAFGNFLQTAGTVMQIHFNMWNVMEYSIGFFGGTALAYSVYTSRWPEKVEAPRKRESRTAFFIVIAFFPLIVFRESLLYSDMIKRFDNIAFSETIAMLSSVVAGLLIMTAIIVLWWQNERVNFSFSRNNVWLIFGFYIVNYVAVSFIVTGAFAGNIMLNHILYVVNLIVIFLLAGKLTLPFRRVLYASINVRQWGIYLFFIVIFISIIAFISISIHGEMGGAHDRFPVN